MHAGLSFSVHKTTENLFKTNSVLEQNQKAFDFLEQASIMAASPSLTWESDIKCIQQAIWNNLSILSNL